ncbi:MAG: hypothetical protein AMXMBFR23_06140 [Chloroflexota bacterium]
MRATLQAIMPYELHGTRYYQVIFQPEGGQPQQARLSWDMVDADLQPGEAVEVNAILGIVDSVRRVKASN